MKRITAYRLVSDKSDFFKDIDLEPYLKNRLFEPVQKIEYKSVGFVNTPAGELVSKIMGRHHFSVQYEERILPPAVVKAEVEDRIEKSGAMYVGRKERRHIRDEVIFDFLPKSFTKKNKVDCFISGDMFFVAASSNQAEYICSALRS